MIDTGIEINELHSFKATGDMVILTRDEYDRLLDRREADEDVRVYDEAVAELAAGGEVLPESFVAKLLAADSLVREWRIFRGFSQSDLANAAGVRQATISAIEKGTASPRIDTAKRIADALGCDLDDLF